MNWNRWIRQIHRWLSILFTVTVIANFVALSRGGTPPPWITYAPLFPLALLLFTGLYMFGCAVKIVGGTGSAVLRPHGEPTRPLRAPALPAS